MASYNKSIQVGNVVRDIELRYTQSGTAVADVGLAVNERVKERGEWVDKVSFFDWVLFGRVAEIANEYLVKGSAVLLEGRAQFDQWEKDGQKRSKVKFICDRMQMLGSKSDSAPNDRKPKSKTIPGTPASQQARFANQVDDDIPF